MQRAEERRNILRRLDDYKMELRSIESSIRRTQERARDLELAATAEVKPGCGWSGTDATNFTAKLRK